MDIAVVGCGYWGKNLVRNFHALGRLHTVCDLDEDIRARCSQDYPDVAIEHELEVILENDEIRGVVIATPAETHFRLAERVLRAGKDVFVEKPLSLERDQGKALLRLAEKQDRIIFVGHVLEYHPAFVKLAEMINDGVLGRVRYVYSNRLNLGKVRREENILWSFAPHDIALILRLVGQMPFEVVACGGSYLQPNVADVTVTQLLFDNGVRAHIFVSWLHPFKEQRLVVVGSEKMASYDDVAKQLVVYDQKVHLERGKPVPVKGDGMEVSFDTDEPLRLECQAFLDSIDSRRTPLTDGESGLKVLTVLQAAQRSLMTNGRPVEVPERAGRTISRAGRSATSVR